MKFFDSIDSALDFAIELEEEAFAMYHSLARMTADKNMRATFIALAEEEAGHKRRLEAVKEGEIQLLKNSAVPDLHISAYLVDIQPTAEMTLQDSLVYAIKREESAHKLYIDFAGAVAAPALQEMFLALAAEEARHKLRFETIYEAGFMPEN
ncbi:MAG: ferritin family protein [Kiritimatiellales bacterium]